MMTNGSFTRMIVAASLLMAAGCSHWGHAPKAAPSNKAARAQLSIGYSLLYQEADGIPKLKWLLAFKNKSDDMGRTTDDLLSFYQHLAATLQKLSKEFPAVRIDATTMSQIEADERKAIGTDLAKDLAPVVGKSGIEFEREALLTFHDSLNEQRHLVAVMLKLETDAASRKFLESTRTELDVRYARLGALLERRYFTH